MIVHQLEMYNFRQYIGRQKIEFSTDAKKNVTVLLGVNTSGKTTIIRAFEWCLYGKNQFEDQVLLNSNVCENMQVDDTQETWVAITFTHDDKQYTLKRKYKYMCNERFVREADGKIIVGLNKKPEEDLTLIYLQPDGQTKTPIDRQNIMESMDRILPRDLSDYFFFGGERISSIANRADLSNAVRGLMGLTVLENASVHLNKVTKQFRNMIDTSGDIYAQKMKDALATYKKKHEEKQEECSECEKEMEYWRAKEVELNAELAKSNVDEVKKAKIERDRISTSLRREQDSLEEYKNDMVKHFNTKPFAFFGMPAINKALEVLEVVKDSTESVPAMEQEAVDFLIHRQCCICGTQLLKGTMAYEKVMDERRKMPPEHIGTVVQTYKSKSEVYLAGSDSFVNSIKEDYISLRKAKRYIGNLEDEFAKQSEKIIDDTAAKELESKRKDAETHYRDAREDYNQCVKLIGEYEGKIKDAEQALEKYARSSIKNTRVNRLIRYSENILDWITQNYKDKENTVREELANRVNKNFKSMYHGERSILIDEKYRVGYSDVDTDESDGLKAVKSFAFIASLVSMAKDKILDDNNMKLGQVYPLVMDAPFSNVDEIHIENICKILPKTANQIILAVMQKDWEYASGKLNPYVGKSYQILKDRDADNKEIETSTHIKE